MCYEIHMNKFTVLLLYNNKYIFYFDNIPIVEQIKTD